MTRDQLGTGDLVTAKFTGDFSMVLKVTLCAGGEPWEVSPYVAVLLPSGDVSKSLWHESSVVCVQTLVT